MNKSSLIKIIKNGDKHLLGGKFNEALSTYLKPFEKGNELSINPNSDRFKSLQGRILSCFEGMVTNKIDFDPIHINLINLMIKKIKINFTDNLQGTLQTIFLQSMKNFYLKKLTIENVNNGLIKNEIIKKEFINTGTLSIKLDKPSFGLNIFADKVIYDTEFQDIVLTPLNFEIIKKVIFLNQVAEIFLSSLRSFILNESINNIDNLVKEEKLTLFLYNLTFYHLRNEFCSVENELDNQNLKILCERVNKKIENQETILKIEILILLCFNPVSNNKKITKELLLGIDETFFQEIITQQIDKKNQEKRIKNKIEKMHSIENGVSINVRNQYENNPYPRWDEDIIKQKVPYINVIKNQISTNINDIKIKKILVAGCGTGLHPINIALHDRSVSIDAIDLSSASLAYGKKKAEEMNIENINWYQADILNLKKNNVMYDVIESVGVLHHMEDPKKGFDTLSSRLKNDGLMKIGLYSRAFRKTLDSNKDLIKKNIISKDISSIKKARKLLMEKEILNLKDYFLTSPFIDLLMHEQELSFDIDELKLLFEKEFKFLGFSFSVNNKSKINQLLKDNGLDKSNMNEIDNWKKLEQVDCYLFKSMYEFWLQKKS